jgi:hypothetical protein
MQSDIHTFERTTNRYGLHGTFGKDPIERLKSRIEFLVLTYTDIYGINNYEQIEYFNDIIDKLPSDKVKKLNYACFVFGNYIVNSDNEVDKDLLNNLKKFNIINDLDEFNTKKVNEFNITKIDIIRYARFWINYNNENKEKYTKKDVDEVGEEEENENDDDNYKEDENEDDDDNEYRFEDNFDEDEEW